MKANMKRDGRCRTAFTLVELLVVIGVVALLLALLLPTLATIRSSSRQTACAAQQREIGRLLTLRANDHDGYMQPVGRIYIGLIDEMWSNLPTALGDARQRRYSYGPFNPISGALPIDSYLLPLDEDLQRLLGDGDETASELFSCPELPSPTPPVGMVEYDINNVIYFLGQVSAVTYVVNETPFGIGRDRASPRRLRGNLVRVSDSASTVLLGDGDPHKLGAQLQVWSPNPDVAGRLTMASVLALGVTGGVSADGQLLPSTGVVTDLHPDDSANYLMADGHVEKLSATESALSRAILSSE